MYSYPGEYVADFCIVRRDGEYHLLHIRGERWSWPLGYGKSEIDLGHAVSADLRVWNPREPVLAAGTAGAWDEWGVWAPHVVEHDGLYYLFYAGTDARGNQGIGLATSPDLAVWHKHAASPLVRPGPWSDRERGQGVLAKDPMVWQEPGSGRFLMYYTATTADGRACIATAVSTDLIEWRDLGPAFVEEDRSYTQCQSPFLVAHGGKFYLFYTAKGGPRNKGSRPEDFAHFEIAYLMSASPTGGWIKPRNHRLLEGWSCACELPTFDNVTYFLCIVQEEVQGVWGASVLSDPHIVTWQPDGTVAIRECPLDGSDDGRLLFSGLTADLASLVQHGGVWQRDDEGVLIPPESVGDTYLLDTLWGRDVAFEVEVLSAAGGVGSLLVRANPSALAGYRVSLDFDRRSLALSELFPGAPDRPLQQCAVVLHAGQWHKLKVVLQASFFSVYVDGTLTMIRQSRTYDSGCLGLHARGPLAFRAVQANEWNATAGPTGEVWRCRSLPQYLRREPE
ncbi:MAG: family 43 glycosylhydrolase [Dehalococcoidales bacterium]|nr:family 43 glycosylhydrolase [Dehalococcoidales bacterium]